MTTGCMTVKIQAPPIDDGLCWNGRLRPRNSSRAQGVHGDLGRAEETNGHTTRTGAPRGISAHHLVSHICSNDGRSRYEGLANNDLFSRPSWGTLAA